jgi:hypothetical protein
MKKRALGRLAKQRCDVIAVKAKADTVKKYLIRNLVIAIGFPTLCQFIAQYF